VQKITPFLWFDGKAEEAMNFYVGVFRNSKIVSVTRAGEQVITGTFQLEGQEFHALNGGPMYQFTPAISLFVSCENQQEVDALWEKLSEGGLEEQCGWLRDRYGVSWQIIPGILGSLLRDKDPEKSNRVMQAMLQMKKIDIAGLQKAYELA
jgi:predicted 3-demethylubiquinone-9 3-methyltransferase (glyoxalase superfamily)